MFTNDIAQRRSSNPRLVTSYTYKASRQDHTVVGERTKKKHYLQEAWKSRILEVVIQGA